jgi:ABC-type branched-subunit amino acid transport system ATPase component
VGALPLRPPAAVRRHHRGGGAGHAARRARAAPREVPPAEDDLTTGAALEVVDVHKQFGGVRAVNGVSFALERGRIHGLIGPNGSGKTTLFNGITGVERFDRGRVVLDGQRIEGLRPWQIARRGVGRTFQVIRVFPELTALENLMVVTAGPHEAARARARELLAFVKLDRLADEYAGNLSYGQQKLVEFVRMLMRDPSLVLLDEPAAGVNRTLLNDLLDAVRHLRDRGTTVLLVEHDMKVVMGLCETVFVLDHGEMIAEGPPGMIQTDERVIEAYFGR